MNNVESTILDIITTVEIFEEKPVLKISLAVIDYNGKGNAYVFGWGVEWLARLLYTFNEDRLEELINHILLIEMDDKGAVHRIGSKTTGIWMDYMKEKKINTLVGRDGIIVEVKK